MRLITPYVEKDTQWYPIIGVTLTHEGQSLNVKALIDSGASFSIFRSEIAEYLGIEIDRGEKLYLEGVGGRILGYLHEVELSIGKKKIRCKIFFSREFTVSFNLIGRDNFFLEFLVTFDEKNKRTILENSGD